MTITQIAASFGRPTLLRLLLLAAIGGIACAAANAVLAWAALAQFDVEDGLLLPVAFLAFLALEKFVTYWALLLASARVTQANTQLQFDFVRRVLSSDLTTIERVGMGEITGTLARCTGAMAAAVFPLSRLVFPISGVIGTVVVLAYVSGDMLSVFCVALAGMIAAWLVCQALLLRRLKTAYRHERDLSAALAELFAGFKEIKLAPAKGAGMESERLEPTIVSTAEARGATGSMLALSHVLANAVPLLLAMVLGLLVPALTPALAVIGALAASVVITLPTGILEFAIDVARANAAYGEFGAVAARLAPEPSPAKPVQPVRTFESLSFEDVTFPYTDEGGEAGFRVGPLSFTIPAGKITFIIGGNGSGKSTLMDLLTGFLVPERGIVRLNGEVVDLRTARHLFGAIFTDFHLFDRLYGHHEIDPSRVNALLKRFEINGVTSFENGQFTRLALSTGQRKRLAMVVCMLDDRPVFVLDEWAADQDPEFREMYYRVLLPELRAAGKTIIAVTHDDRFFDVADHRLRLEYGRIVAVDEPAPVLEEADTDM